MITTGNRHLKDITDDELAMILEISHLYGAKEFWGEPKITRINRTMFKNSITIRYGQKRLSDGLESSATLHFDYGNLSYWASFREPYSRMSDRTSVCDNTQMFLWLMAQDFNVLEPLVYARITPRNAGTYKTMGFLVANGGCGDIELEGAKFFGPDNLDDAVTFKNAHQEGDDFMNVYTIIEDKEY